MANCHGCGTKLPPKTWIGRDQKWCSERCRKLALYVRQCVDCGAPCNTDGRVTNASERCGSCNAEYVKKARDAAKRVRWAEIAEMRNDGMLNVEIACELGISTAAVGSLIHRARREGFEIAPSPWWKNAA